MGKQNLRHGYTTGACAAAASAGATRMLVQQKMARQVTLPLPAGFNVCFKLKGQAFTAAAARCFVIKDAGDDPDVTHGAELHSRVAWDPAGAPGQVTLLAGEGIGTVTKPGLAVAPGEPAINPVPRRMICTAVRRELDRRGVTEAVQVTLSIPDGVARAARTLNARLGIVGGLSLLGTSGVVRPVSHQAWRDTMDTALDVAVAAGSRVVVLSGGRASEQAAQQTLALPEDAYILMGDHVGYALASCQKKGLRHLVVSLQFAKLVKVAAGHAWTHAHAAELKLAELAAWAAQAGLDDRAIRRIKLANTSREALLAQAEPLALADLVGERALQAVRARAPQLQCGILLIGYSGQVLARYGEIPQTGKDVPS